VTNELWLAILSSSLISGIIGALIAGWFTLRSKRTEYANTYYKLVLERRLAAYEQIERLIIAIKISVADDDQRLYHIIFSNEDDYAAEYKLLFAVMENAMWLSDDIFDVTREVNLLLFTHDARAGNLIEFGKNNYVAIGELRMELERLHARDLLTLHNVPKFLKSKRPKNSYTPLPKRGA
jgi:hypothetical protein